MWSLTLLGGLVLGMSISKSVGDVLVVDVLEKSLACSNVSQSRPEPRGLAAKSSREHVEESPMPPMPTGRRTRV